MKGGTSMELTAVKQIKTARDEATVNILLSEDWVLLEISHDEKGLVYHLGYVSGITRKRTLICRANHR